MTPSPRVGLFWLREGTTYWREFSADDPNWRWLFCKLARDPTALVRLCFDPVTPIPPCSPP